MRQLDSPPPDAFDLPISAGLTVIDSDDAGSVLGNLPLLRDQTHENTALGVEAQVHLHRDGAVRPLINLDVCRGVESLPLHLRHNGFADALRPLRSKRLQALTSSQIG